MRNFYVETYVDGRVTPLKGGPRRKDSGFKTSIKMLVNGSIEEVVKIEGIANEEGKLSLFVFDLQNSEYIDFYGSR